jgi:hypothetical protein
MRMTDGNRCHGHPEKALLVDIAELKQGFHC